MASVSSVGIGSGVLTSDLIDQLVEAERAPSEKRLDIKEEAITTELSVFGQIQSAITDLRLPSRSLADPDLFQTLNASSGSSAFSATASSDAQTGSYSLEVTALAKAQSLSTAEIADADTTAIGEGTLSFTINGTTTDILIDGSNNTLNGIAAAINDNDELAANASVLFTGSGYKLVITSQETGLENAMEISVSDNDGTDLNTSGLSQLSYTTNGFNLSQNQEASNAAFSLNGIALSRSSNTVTDVLDGVTLTLSGTNAGAPAALTFSRDTDLVVEKVQDFVDKYNAVQQLIAENTAFNPDNPAASGILMGDSATRSIINQLQSVFGRTVQGLENASVRNMADVGITTNKDSGQLEFDSDVFKTKLAADAESVTAIFADQGRTSDNQIEFVRAGSKTKVGTYDINVTQLATKGVYTGGNISTTTVDGTNNTFTLTLDGTSSGTITLDQAAYATAEDLAAEIQLKINADTALSDAGKSVSVSVSGNQFVITSNAFGSESIVNIDTTTADNLGLSVANGVDGLDVEGTINGATATGNGQFLTAAEGDDSESIRIKVTGGATGDRGNVTYIEGVGEQLVDLINGFLGSNGAITAKNELLNTRLAGIAEDRIELTERVESLEARLVRQFTAADIIIAQLNSTQDFISKQLDALVASSKGDS